MAITERKGNVIIVDLSKIPYEFASPEFINLHIKDLVSMNLKGVKKIRYEEEETFELSEEDTKVLIEYANFIKEVEKIMLRRDVYGLPSDENYSKRKETLRRFYEYLFMNPYLAEEILADYSEPYPSKAIYLEGQRKYMAWIKGILNAFKKVKMYELVKKYGEMRAVFLNMIGLRALHFVNMLVLDIPKNAKPLKDGKYKLRFGYEVQIYDLINEESYLYVIKNPILEGVSDYWKRFLRNLIEEQVKEDFTGKDYRILFELKVKEYRQKIINHAILNNVPVKPEEAEALAHEAAAWVVGLGSPLESIALDQENVVDIYIDGENIPIYIEHKEYGICHTLYRYNRPLLERAFKNIVLGSGRGVKFDENVPIADVVVKRLSLRCHLQRPPATFNELQGALRVLREYPFTYPMYFFYKSVTPFFAGYDDVMVNLGNSEAVLGIKSSGKTAMTSTKIIAIGQKKRIVTIEDIEEMPIRAYRKRGFHISTVRVKSTDIETGRTKTIDLVTMANALLRMGDTALIINEVRSREAVQGIINLLNTQPGVFLLYNLHAESLQEIQDRLELVFGIPSVTMLSTDRYTFLTKTKFKRKSKYYRVLLSAYESDKKEREFKKVFELQRGKDINSSRIKNMFLKNAFATEWRMGNVNFRTLEKELDIAFIPPALQRRANNTSIEPENYILQMIYKGKVFEDIYEIYESTGEWKYLEIDFVLQANALANRILLELEDENGDIDFYRAYNKWSIGKKELVKEFKKLIVQG